MSDLVSTKTHPIITEAPASWNTRYLSPEGFVCQITLRADSGKELLEKSAAAIAHLLQAGCVPCENLTFRPRSNGNGNGHKPEEAAPQAAPAAPANGNGSGSAHLCPIHGVEMKRWEKDGRIWYSHKVEDGWCTGKSK